MTRTPTLPDTRVAQAAAIKARLAERGYALGTVDQLYRLTGGSARNALRLPHEPGEKAIAKALGTKPHLLWPERYDASGKRLTPQPPQNYVPLPNLKQRRNAHGGSTDGHSTPARQTPTGKASAQKSGVRQEAAE